MAITFTTCDSFWMSPQWIVVAKKSFFRVSMCPMSIAVCLPSFGISICHIVLMRAKKKMVRIYTVFDIAMMTDAHTVRYGSIYKLIHKSMSRDGDSWFWSKIPISIWFPIPCPQPTRTSFFYMQPKSFHGRAFLPFMFTGLRAVRFLGSCYRRRFTYDQLSTDGAYTLDRHAQPPFAENDSVEGMCGNVVRKPRLSNRVMTPILATGTSVA